MLTSLSDISRHLWKSPVLQSAVTNVASFQTPQNNHNPIRIRGTKWKELSDEGSWATCSCPNRLLWKWQIDSRRTLLRGTYDISMSEWALDSRTLVQWFGCFVSLSSPRGILFVYWKILKISRHLQKFIWSVIHCHSKTISFNIKWLYRKEKKNYV